MAPSPPLPAAAAHAAASPRRPSWRRARVETTIALSTTGGTVWGAAEAAIAFFEMHWDALVPSGGGADGAEGEHGISGGRRCRVLELGAGCGKLGLTLALNRPGECSVLLTEQAGGGALEHLERNVRINVALEGEGAAVAAAAAAAVDARAAACDWGDFLLIPGADGSPEAAAEEQEEEGQALVEEERGAADAAAAAAAAGAGGGDGGGGRQQQRQDEEEEEKEEDRDWRSCLRVSPLPRIGSLPRADVIVGSDLIYLLEGARALPRAIAALLRRAQRRDDPAAPAAAADAPTPLRRPRPPAVAYYAHTRHRFDALDVEFEEQCLACGLELVELDAETARPLLDGGGGRPSSPPPFSELFPEHRVAIYRLRLLG